MKSKFSILLIAFIAFSINIVANETIRFTWQGNANDDHKWFFVTATSGKQFTIDWGDGSDIETFTGTGDLEQDIRHIYDNTDTYTVSITADCLFTALVCANSQVTNLDLSECTALEYLNCSWNQLTDLDLSTNIALKTLDCSRNQLVNLDLRVNTALEEVYCSLNQLTVLDLKGCTALQNLECNNNYQLTVLNLLGCISLQNLWCFESQLIDLDLSGCVALTHLLCNFNQLTDLNLSNCVSLEYLLCNNNQLSNLDLRGCPALQTLHCYSNPLTDLKLSNCTALEVLYCYHSQLANLDLSECTALGYLECNNNLLTDLDLSANTLLEVLYCHNNQLTVLDLSANTRLNSLRCENNRLQLSDLYAASEKITHLSSKYLGPQILVPQLILVNSSVDYSAQREFGGIATNFIVEKDNSLALPSDYAVSAGIITFYEIGNYIIAMTNSAIVSDMSYPAEVIAEINVTNNSDVKTLQSQTNINIYPNPTIDIVYIQTESNVKIYNMQGEILQETFGSQIDMSSYPQGIYFLQVDGQIIKVVKM